MARHQRRRAAIRAPVGSHVELAPDSARPGARILYVDGVAQSYVDMADPAYLHFDYVRRMASVVDAAAPEREPVRALHLGGGGFTLPRYLAATGGRRYGNIVLVAASRPGRLPVARLTTRASRDPVAGVVLQSAALDSFVAGAQPLGDSRPTDTIQLADTGNADGGRDGQRRSDRTRQEGL